MSKTRNTPARLAIEELLELSDSALSHHGIQLALGDMCNRVTIYRVLDRLIDEGRVHKILDTSGISHYAPCEKCMEHSDHIHNHIHFKCNKCNSIICLEQVIPEIKTPVGYKFEEVNFLISGTCDKCE